MLLVMERALARANRFVVRLTPIGLFAIAAYTLGTVDMEQLRRVKIYLLSYGAMALLLTLWVLPGFVACLTGIPARRVLNQVLPEVKAGQSLYNGVRGSHYGPKVSPQRDGCGKKRRKGHRAQWFTQSVIRRVHATGRRY